MIVIHRAREFLLITTVETFGWTLPHFCDQALFFTFTCMRKDDGLVYTLMYSCISLRPSTF